jgi:flagella basal body P-ring formation protein FlgA
VTLLALSGAPNSLEAQLSSGIAAEARQQLGLDDEAEVEVARMDSGDPLVFARDGKLISFEIASKGRPLGWTTVRVTIERRKVRADHWVRAEIIAKVPTLVAARPLERGEVLDEGDLREALTPLGFDRSPTLARVIGGKLKVDIAKGAPISERWVERPEIISRGSRIEAVVAGEAFSVKAQAEALEGGALGDEIAVRVLGKRVIRGVVTGRDTVEVR